jgi:aryl-alcohol dehydrogenase-like predicted oxidoreductase
VLDLFQLHSPPVELLREPAGPLETLARLRAEGLIRAIGVSARSPADALVAAARPEVDCVQVNFNLLDQRALESGLFDACAARGVGVIARTPLCFGFLTGRSAADQVYGAHDHRSTWSVAQREAWASGPALFAAWRGGGAETAAQFALRYCLSQPAVTCAIPGMLTPSHVAENAAASELGALPAAALAAIADTYRRHSFFVREPRKEPSS